MKAEYRVVVKYVPYNCTRPCATVVEETFSDFEHAQIHATWLNLNHRYNESYHAVPVVLLLPLDEAL